MLTSPVSHAYCVPSGFDSQVSNQLISEVVLPPVFAVSYRDAGNIFLDRYVESTFIFSIGFVHLVASDVYLLSDLRRIDGEPDRTAAKVLE